MMSMRLDIPLEFDLKGPGVFGTGSAATGQNMIRRDITTVCLIFRHSLSSDQFCDSQKFPGQLGSRSD